MSEPMTQWSTVKGLISKTERDAMTWMSAEDRERVSAYLKYDEMYWNDPRQYALRVLDGEEPVYIPIARTVVDTTAHYILKGLEITAEDETTKKELENFLKREAFYSRFNTAKVAGVARGDYIFHMTANPSKEKGSRISLNAVEPMNVFPIWDENEPGKMTGCHLATPYLLPIDKDPEQRTHVRRLTYRIEEVAGKKRISRHEVILRLEGTWFGGESAKLVETVIPKGLLHERITTIPLYWFKNRHWDGEDFGSSELRGVERLAEIISQSSTDVTAALALEGLGVYATDGGRPVAEDKQGNVIETEWEVSPGKVMEVPQGSFFRRVEGISSITPAKDNITYLEQKINEAVGLSDVALGRVDAQVAQSGIALAIKFMPTMAKIEARDAAGLDVLTQMFYDWKTWHGVFEQQLLEGDIVPTIGDKLPLNRTERVNELNNMMDRKVITKKYYREQMEALGYTFPEDIEEELQREAMAAFKLAQEMAAINGVAPNNQDSGGGSGNEPNNGSTLPQQSGSNNRSRPNESSGTEANTRDA